MPDSVERSVSPPVSATSPPRDPRRPPPAVPPGGRTTLPHPGRIPPVPGRAAGAPAPPRERKDDGWTSTSTRASSCSRATGSPCPTAGSPRRPRRPAPRPRHRRPRGGQGAGPVGGRGKAGGIKLADDPRRGRGPRARHPRHGHQGPPVTGSGSRRRRRSQREYYASVTFDRGEKKPLVMLSAAGGIDIEEVAADRPEALARLHIDPLIGLPAAPRALAGLPRRHRRRGDPRRRRIIRQLYAGVRRPRRHADGDQPADPHGGRPGDRARRQGDDRQQRAVPPPRDGGVPGDHAPRTRRSGWPRSGASPT